MWHMVLWSDGCWTLRIALDGTPSAHNISHISWGNDRRSTVCGHAYGHHTSCITLANMLCVEYGIITSTDMWVEWCIKTAVTSLHKHNCQRLSDLHTIYHISIPADFSKHWPTAHALNQAFYHSVTGSNVGCRILMVYIILAEPSAEQRLHSFRCGHRLVVF